MLSSPLQERDYYILITKLQQFHLLCGLVRIFASTLVQEHARLLAPGSRLAVLEQRGKELPKVRNGSGCWLIPAGSHLVRCCSAFPPLSEAALQLPPGREELF